MKIQLQHDAEQREKERQMDLRREVFLGAAETLGRQSDYINLFGKIDFDFWKEQEILKGSIGVANKSISSQELKLLKHLLVQTSLGLQAYLNSQR